MQTDSEAAPRPFPTPRPMVLAVLALWLGHFLGDAWRDGSPNGWLLVSFGALALMMVLRHRPMAMLMAFAMAALGLGGWQRSLLNERIVRTREAFAPLADQAVRLARVEGRLASMPKPTRRGWMLRLEAGSMVGAGGRVMVTTSPLMLQVTASRAIDRAVGNAVLGDGIVAWGTVVASAGDLEVAPEDQWLFARGAPLLVNAREVSVTMASGMVHDALRAVARTGGRLEARFVRVMGAEQGSLLSGLLLGRVQAVATERAEAFRRAGLWHLFSVSGTHTVLIGAATLGALSLAGVPGGVRLLVFLPLLAAFSVVTGLQPPVLRAGLVLAALAIGGALQREVDRPSALATVTGGMLVAQPELAFAPDFQMTVLCGLAMALLAPWNLWLEEFLGQRLGWSFGGRVVLALVHAMVVSVVLQAAITPVLASMGSETSLIAPVANGLLLVAVSVVLQVAFFASLVTLVLPGAADPLFRLLVVPLEWIENGCAMLAALPWATAPTDGWRPWMGAAWLMALFLTPWTWRRADWPMARPWVIAATPVALAFVLIVAVLLRPEPPALRLWFLDVGQGDAMVLVSRDGSAVLVDTGPGGNLAARLRRRGIRRLEAVVATHGDADHIGGLAAVIRGMPVSRILLGGTGADSAVFAEAAAEVRSRAIPVTTLLRGATVTFGEPPVRLRVLQPSEEFLDGDASRNDASLVLMVEGPGGFRALLAADAEVAAEDSMIRAGTDLRARVLKVGHHGAITSSGEPFLDAVQPDFAVVSVGAGNRFGHPHPEVLRRLEDRGVVVLRTDRDGSIRIDVEADGRMRVLKAR